MHFRYCITVNSIWTWQSINDRLFDEVFLPVELGTKSLNLDNVADLESDGKLQLVIFCFFYLKLSYLGVELIYSLG